MKQTAKTIQIFLPDGNPRGIRFSEITTRIVQAIEIPRSLLSAFYDMPESDQVAVYFLFGEADESEPKVYIGQTGDLRSRLKSHNKLKDFWQRAVVVLSKTQSMTQTHAIFLEWYCLKIARSAGRYQDENGNNGSKPYTPAPLEADCLEIFDTAKTLLSTLGFPLFSEVVSTEESPTADELFYCKGSEANGIGLYTAEGFVVLKGSDGRVENVPSLGAYGENLRENLVEQGICTIEGSRLIFQRDHIFGSPSIAALSLQGRRANGWIE